MTLSAGARLGPYEIQAPIGTGGMGEVYRARDTRLGRTVAIKVLPEGVAADPARRRRFEQEARAASALNHPHIYVLHDIGDAVPSGPQTQACSSSSVSFLVMEHLEGETLAKRLAKGPLPLDQVLEVGAQIGEALATAHRHGIVHRDLKPANVMLVKGDGGARTHAKLLDFGLARLTETSGRGAESATESGSGVVVGTAPYMAPEQVEGRPADARTDVFALGAVLYEMLTGKRAFAGDSSAAVMAAILEREPAELSSVQPLTPPPLQRLVKRCLAKEPDARWQSAADVADELRWLRETDGASTRAIDQPRRGGQLVPLVIVGTVMAVAGAGLVWLMRPAVQQPSLRHVSLEVRPAEALGRAGSVRTPGGHRTALTWTPDGQALVFVGRRDERLQLYVRRLDEGEARPLAGTEGAMALAVSPDGQWIAFWANFEIKKVPVGGGPVERVCGTGRGEVPFGMSWGDDGGLVYAIDMGGLWRVSSEGGTPQPLTQLRPGEVGHRLPHLLPGGRTVMFTVRSTRYTWGHEQIVVESLDTHERRLILDHGADARFVKSGHVVFMDLGRLAAVPFDPVRLTVTGPPVVLMGDVAQAVNEGVTGNDSGAGQFSVSAAGDLAYVASPGGIVPLARRELAWVDRRGVVTPRSLAEQTLSAPSLAPDGQRAAVIVADTTSRDLWIVDLARGTRSRLTEDTEALRGLWSPDGRELMIAMGDGSIVRRPLFAGGTSTEVARAPSGVLLPSSWSRDGILAFLQGAEYARFDISVLDLRDPKSVPRVFVGDRAAETYPEFSPDGRWLAYVSDESGRAEVYVLPYPGPGDRVQVSTQGGSNPLWNPKGRELFFVSPDIIYSPAVPRWMQVVDVAQRGTTLEVSPARALFAWPDGLGLGTSINTYSVAPDGQRFLATRRVSPPPPSATVTHINLILNWFEELKAKVPIK